METNRKKFRGPYCNSTILVRAITSKSSTRHRITIITANYRHQHTKVTSLANWSEINCANRLNWAVCVTNSRAMWRNWHQLQVCVPPRRYSSTAIRFWPVQWRSCQTCRDLRSVMGGQNRRPHRNACRYWCGINDALKSSQQMKFIELNVLSCSQYLKYNWS